MSARPSQEVRDALARLFAVKVQRRRGYPRWGNRHLSELATYAHGFSLGPVAIYVGRRALERSLSKHYRVVGHYPDHGTVHLKNCYFDSGEAEHFLRSLLPEPNVVFEIQAREVFYGPWSSASGGEQR